MKQSIYQAADDFWIEQQSSYTAPVSISAKLPRVDALSIFTKLSSPLCKTNYLSRLALRRAKVELGLKWHFQCSLILGGWMGAAQDWDRSSSAAAAQQRSSWAGAVSLDKKIIVNFHGPHRTNLYHREILSNLQYLPTFLEWPGLSQGGESYFFCELQSDWILSMALL